jgi:Na+-transporting methylmalonyl-CoA/oxaloacetate decarboxylase gamma subunit
VCDSNPKITLLDSNSIGFIGFGVFFVLLLLLLLLLLVMSMANALPSAGAKNSECRWELNHHR